MKSRYFLTSLYHETMQRIMDDALNDVELALMEKRVITIRKVVLEGNPVKKLVEYAYKYPIDLIVISTSRNEMVPIGVIGSTARRIIAKTNVPVLVYTPLSPSKEIMIKRVLILPILTSSDRIKLLKEIVDDLAKRMKVEIAVHTKLFEEASKILITELEKESLKYNSFSEEIKEPRELMELIEKHDLVVMPRYRKGITQRVKTTIPKTGDTNAHIDIIITGLSPRPVILV